MIEEPTGHIADPIEFEGAPTASLYECVCSPRGGYYIPTNRKRLMKYSEGPEATFEGGENWVRWELWAVFMDKVDSRKRRASYELWEPCRDFTDSRLVACSRQCALLAHKQHCDPPLICQAL